MSIKWIFGVQCLGLLTYEGIALYRNQGETISEITWNLIAQYPLIAFAWGLLMGHFVWQRGVYRALGIHRD